MHIRGWSLGCYRGKFSWGRRDGFAGYASKQAKLFVFEGIGILSLVANPIVGDFLRDQAAGLTLSSRLLACRG